MQLENPGLKKSLLKQINYKDQRPQNSLEKVNGSMNYFCTISIHKLLFHTDKCHFLKYIPGKLPFSILFPMCYYKKGMFISSFGKQFLPTLRETVSKQ